MQYLNFELVIQAQGAGTDTYSVFAQGVSGESHLGVLDLAASQTRLRKMGEQIGRQVAGDVRSFMPEQDAPPASEGLARQLGVLLFEAAFAGEVGEVFRVAKREAKRTGAGLRVRLRLQEAPALHQLPWEYLHDGQDFIATDVRAPIVRYTERARAADPLTVQGPLRMLVVVSSPTDLGQLDAASEQRRVRGALADLEDAGRLIIDVLEDGRWERLVDTLSPGAGPDYHLLHFIGHGGVDPKTQAGQLLFTDAEGQAVAQDADSIATLLKNHPSLKLVVLNACQGATASAVDIFSSLAATLVDRAVPGVVAMQFAITDRAAIGFSKTFYGMLARGNPVETAMAMARVAEYTRPRAADEARSLEWGTPVLYLRALEGALFELLDSDGAPIHPIESQLPEGMAPYRGLAPFDVEHAQIFLGRAAEVAALEARLDGEPRLVTVVAASGSGKSSLVRAGLLPTALRGGWIVATMVPGERACEALAMALLKALPAACDGRSFNRASIELTEEIREASAKSEFATSLRKTAARGVPAEAAGLLLVVDQFEEVFTLARDDAERTAFMRNLAEAVQASGAPVRVILTMRADFTGHVLRDAHLGPLLEASAFYLRPMTPEQLREVIEEPAKLAGYRFEPGLVDELVDKVQGEPGDLALLAFVLEQLWARRDQVLGVLRWDAYRALGGLRGAINAHAEAVVETLSAPERALLQDLFGHLVRPGQGTEDTRARAARSDLEALGDDAGAIIERLIAAPARLLTARHDLQSGRDEIEMAHEALIREWKRLRDWIDAAREGLILRQQIEQAAALWLADGRSPDALWRGSSLARAIELRDTGSPPLTAHQRAFVDASAAVVAEEARAATSRRRWVIGGLIVGVVLAIGAAVGGFTLWDQADTARAEASDALERMKHARDRADTQRARAAAHATRAQALLRLSVMQQLKETDPTTAALLAAETEAPDESADVMQLLIDLSGRPGLLRAELGSPDSPVGAAMFSPDGARVVTWSDASSLRVWDADGLRPPITLEGHDKAITSAAFSTDGARLVTTSEDGTVRVWSGDRWRRSIVLSGEAPIRSAVISPDGKYVGTVSRGGATVWSVATGQPAVARSLDVDDPIDAIAFSPDGRRVVTTSHAIARIWEVASDAAPIELPGHEEGLRTAVFSSDGKRVLTAAGDGKARIWNADGSGRPIEMLQMDDMLGHKAPSILWSAFFSDDDRHVVTTSGFGTRIWKVAGVKTPEMLLHYGSAGTAVFSPDGERYVTAASDGTARVWSVNDTNEFVTLQGHDGAVASAVFDRSGARVVTASADGTARVWSADGIGQPLVLKGHRGAVESATFSPDGTRVLTTSADGTARIWSLEAWGQPFVVEQIGANQAEWMPDARWIAASNGRHTGLWNVAGTGEFFMYELKNTLAANSMTISRDGARMLVGIVGNSSAFVANTDQSGGIVIQEGSAALSPDGKHVVVIDDHSLEISQIGGSEKPIMLKVDGPEMRSARYSPDGARILTTSTDGSVRLWRADGTGDPLTLEARGHVEAIRFDPASERVLVISEEAARIWQFVGDVRAISLKAHGDQAIGAGRFSPSGDWLLTQAAEALHVWKIADDGEVSLLRTMEGVTTAKFSPDGARIVSLSSDGIVHVQTIDGGQRREVMRGQQGHEALALSPDGVLIALWGRGAVVQVARMEGDGRAIGLGHEGNVHSVAFSPKGRRLLTRTTRIGAVRVWMLDGAALQAGLRAYIRACIPSRLYIDRLGWPPARAKSAADRCAAEKSPRPAP